MKDKKIWIPLFGILLLIFFIVNLSFGTIKIPFQKVIAILLGDTEIKQSWQYIVLNYRLPKATVAVLVGIALSVSGLLMQTLFRNPMAESYVLGISSGAGLGVALVILGSALLPPALVSVFTSSYGIVLVSVLGSFFLLLLVLFVSNRVQNTVTVLIVGIMFGSFANALVSILTFLSSAEQLKRYTLWTLGSLGNITWDMIALFAGCTVLGLFGSLLTVKSLDAFLLGDNYASSMGIDVLKSRNYIILITSLLAGASTALVGPIAFIGLAVPHIVRLILQVSSHRTLIIASAFLGAIIMLICDVIVQVKGDSFLLPINAVTSIFGAPIVIWLLVRKRA